MTKKEFVKKYADAIADMSETENEEELVDLGVGLSMLIHFAVEESRGHDVTELANRLEKPVMMGELIKDVKKVWPNRFLGA